VRTSRRIGIALVQGELDQDGCRFLAEKTPLPYHSLNPEGEILEVNAAWLHLLGFVRDEVIGRRLSDFLPASRQAQFEENFALLRRAGRISKTQLVLVAKNGAVVPVIVEGRVRFGPDGSFRHTHCLLYHIGGDHLGGDHRTVPAGGSPAAGRDLLPICSSCKDIRGSGENWHRLESWFSRHLGIEFSHSLCPSCQKKLYPEHY
jgi:PAS domain S-box-containing protein